MQMEMWIWIWMEEMSEDIGFLTMFFWAILAVHTSVLLFCMELHTTFR